MQHKNLEAVYFRAYALDLETTLVEGEDYNLLPARRQVETLMERSRPSHRWRLELPATPPPLAPARDPPLDDAEQVPAFDPTAPEPVPDFEFDQRLSW